MYYMNNPTAATICGDLLNKLYNSSWGRKERKELFMNTLLVFSSFTKITKLHVHQASQVQSSIIVEITCTIDSFNINIFIIEI